MRGTNEPRGWADTTILELEERERAIPATLLIGSPRILPSHWLLFAYSSAIKCQIVSMATKKTTCQFSELKYRQPLWYIASWITCRWLVFILPINFKRPPTVGQLIATISFLIRPWKKGELGFVSRLFGWRLLNRDGANGWEIPGTTFIDCWHFWDTLIEWRWIRGDVADWGAKLLHKLRIPWLAKHSEIQLPGSWEKLKILLSWIECHVEEMESDRGGSNW